MRLYSNQAPSLLRPIKSRGSRCVSVYVNELPARRTVRKDRHPILQIRGCLNNVSDTRRSLKLQRELAVGVRARNESNWRGSRRGARLEGIATFAVRACGGH